MTPIFKHWLDPADLKLYILIKHDIPIGHAINSAVHAGVGAVTVWLEAERANLDVGPCNSPTHEWLEHSFKKVCVSVTDEQFDRAKQLPDAVVFTESDLDNTETAIALKPRHEWPGWLRRLPLYGSSKAQNG